MKTFSILLVFFFVSSVSYAQKSPRKQSEGQINDFTVSVDYGAPSVRGRTIWGGLEKYGKVWRAGANENTTFAFDKEVTIMGNKLPAGKYGFFIIPNEKGTWTIIFNKKNDAWGASSYNQQQDALRVDIQPEFVNDVQEQLTYEVKDKAVIFAWDKARITIPME